MATKKKLLQAAAGSAGGAGGLDITDVFSTYLYTGTGAARSFNNGIDLAGEGGLVWIKTRSATAGHSLQDTERGAGNMLSSNGTWANSSRPDTLTSFNSNGFSLGADTVGYVNYSSSYTYASFSFRKAAKFFDLVTWTGSGSARSVSHNLGHDVGMVIVKKTSGSSSAWRVWHRGLGGSNYLTLDTTAASGSSTQVFSSAPTSTQINLGASGSVNSSGESYVAYVFAHNDSGDGEFGPDGDQDTIKCGSFTTDGSGIATVDLGFEPQWVMIKAATTTGPWRMLDSMRGLTVGNNDVEVYADSNSAEAAGGVLDPSPTGFSSTGIAGSTTYVYMAIRRGQLAVPEDATEVFAIDTLGGTSPNPPGWNAGFPVDFAIRGNTASFAGVAEARLLGTKYLNTNGTNAENTSTLTTWDYMDGFFNSTSVSSNYYSWMWKRAPGYFDAVAYTGDGVAGRTVSHNLGVAPEMMWVKRRSSSALWAVYHKDLGNTKYIQLQSSAAAGTLSTFWNDTSPTSTDFTVGTYTAVNGNADTFVAYLFASLPGISKVGSYTGNSGTQTIDCGFTSGARFVLIKRTDSTGDWYVWDAERGIVAGNDPYLELNTTDAEVTSTDWVDPDNSGFIVNGTTINASSASYIFYAIA